MGTFREPLYLAATLLPAAIAAVWDARTRRIPNWLTGPTFLCGILLHLVLGGFASAGLAFAAGLTAGTIFLVFHLAGGMGAGDVKLIAAIGAVSGFHFLPQILISTALVGGVLAILLSLARGKFLQTMRNVGALATHHRVAGLAPHPELNVTNSATIRLPYAIAIGAGCLITFLAQYAAGAL